MYSFIIRLYEEFILWTPFFQSIKENALTIITFSREPQSNHYYFQGRMNELYPAADGKDCHHSSTRSTQHRTTKAEGSFLLLGPRIKAILGGPKNYQHDQHASPSLSCVWCILKKNRKTASQAVISPKIVFPLSSHVHQQPWGLWTSDYSISDGMCHEAMTALSHYSTQ